MELWLVRHANAEAVSGDGTDERRALDGKGRADFERSVAGLARLKVRFDRVLFSPFLRAQETAGLLMTACDGEAEASLELCDQPRESLLERLQQLHESSERLRDETPRENTAHLALVGHEPWLSQLAAWLVFGWRVYDVGPARQVIAIHKGGVVHLSGAPRPGEMTLVAAYPPSALRKLARR